MDVHSNITCNNSNLGHKNYGRDTKTYDSNGRNSANTKLNRDSNTKRARTNTYSLRRTCTFPCDTCWFNIIPSETVYHILSFLTASDLLSLSLTSNMCSTFAQDDLLWRGLCMDEFLITGIDPPMHLEEGLSWKGEYVVMMTRLYNAQRTPIAQQPFDHRTTIQYTTQGITVDQVDEIRPLILSTTSPFLPLPFWDFSVSYYEVTITRLSTYMQVSIGLAPYKLWSSKYFSKKDNDYISRYAEFDSDGVCDFAGMVLSPEWVVGDVVGMGIDYSAGEVFVTRNCELLAKFRVDDKYTLRPTITLGTKVAVAVNFGKTPFAYDLRGIFYQRSEGYQVGAFRPYSIIVDEVYNLTISSVIDGEFDNEDMNFVYSAATRVCSLLHHRQNTRNKDERFVKWARQLDAIVRDDLQHPLATHDIEVEEIIMYVPQVITRFTQVNFIEHLARFKIQEQMCMLHEKVIGRRKNLSGCLIDTEKDLVDFHWLSIFMILLGRSRVCPSSLQRLIYALHNNLFKNEQAQNEMAVYSLLCEYFEEHMRQRKTQRLNEQQSRFLYLTASQSTAVHMLQMIVYLGNCMLTDECVLIQDILREYYFSINFRKELRPQRVSLLRQMCTDARKIQDFPLEPDFLDFYANKNF